MATPRPSCFGGRPRVDLRRPRAFFAPREGKRNVLSWIDEKVHKELARVRLAREKQVYPHFRAFESSGLHATIDGKPIINFSSNDYLGLTTHPKVKEASRKAVEKFACGLSS